MPNYVKSSSGVVSRSVKNIEEKISRMGSRKLSVQPLTTHIAPQREVTLEIPKKGCMSKRRIFRVVVGVVLAAGIGALIGGPAGFVVGSVVGATYMIVGPEKILEVIKKSARVVARHLSDGLNHLSDQNQNQNQPKRDGVAA